MPDAKRTLTYYILSANRQGALKGGLNIIFPGVENITGSLGNDHVKQQKECPFKEKLLGFMLLQIVQRISKYSRYAQ